MKTGSKSLSATVIPLNLCIELLLLWFPDISFAVKFVVTSVLIGTAVLSFEPRFVNHVSGGLYALMVFLSILASVVEYFLAWVVSGAFFPYDPRWAFTPFQAVQTAFVYAIVVGLPVVLLGVRLRAFERLLGAWDRSLRPDSLTGGRSAGCLLQAISLFLACVFSFVGMLVLTPEGFEGLGWRLLFGILGPVFMLLGPLLQPVFDLDNFLTLPLSVVLFVSIPSLTYVVNGQFVLIRGLAARLVSPTETTPTAPQRPGEAEKSDGKQERGGEVASPGPGDRSIWGGRRGRLRWRRIEEAKQTDFFRWFSLAEAGSAEGGVGTTVITFRPEGDKFRDLVKLDVSLDGGGIISALRLTLAKSFVDDHGDGVFARDIAKSFIRDALPDEDEGAARGLADEIEYRNDFPVLSRALRPRLPDAPSEGFLTFVGRGQLYEQGLSRSCLRIEQVQDDGRAAVAITVRAL